MKTFLPPHRLVLILLLLAMIFGVQKGTAQVASNPKHTISYTQTSSTNYEISLADRNLLKPVEAIGMKPVNEVRNVSMVIDQGNDITTTINIISSNASEAWMTPPSRIVIDKTGARTGQTHERGGVIYCNLHMFVGKTRCLR